MWFDGLALPEPPWVWQVAQVPGVTPVWSKVAEAKVEKPVWQVSHEAVVATWPDGLPRAFMLAKEPLWQFAHCPGRTPWTAEWVNVEVANVPFMVWHASQESVVGMWFDGLPVAVTPWQVAHVPGVTPI